MVGMLTFIPTLIFSISNPKSIFRQIWSEKVKIIMSMTLSPRSLKLLQFGHCVPYVVFMFCELVILQKKKSKLFILPEHWQSISRIMILIPVSVSWISNLKSIFGEIWSEKVKAVCFTLKLAHTHTHTHTHIHTHTIRVS